MAGIITIISIYLLLNTVGGIFAGGSKKSWTFPCALTAFIALAAVFRLGLHLESEEIGRTVFELIQAKIPVAVYNHNYKNVINIAILPIILAGISCGTAAYCCRRNSQNWYSAVLWFTGTVFLTGFVLYFPLMLTLFFCYTLFSVQDPLSDSSYPVLLCVLSSLLIMMLSWGIYSSFAKNTGKKVILAVWGIFTLIALLGWGTIYIAGKILEAKLLSTAEELKITPLETPLEPPEKYAAQFAQRGEFYDKYPLYSPPYNGVANWYCSCNNCKETLSEEKRRFTLKFFNSPEIEELISQEIKLCLLFNEKNCYYAKALQTLRSVIRHFADRAALFELSGDPDAAIKELSRYIELEKQLSPRPPFIISELVRNACRSYWISAVCKHGSNDAKYAPQYRQFLEFVKNWQFSVPDEAGYFINFELKNENLYKHILMTPAVQAIKYRGFFNAVNSRPNLKAMEQMEVFTDFTNIYPANAAVKLRSGIVQGQIGAALKCFRAEKGYYPDKLEELVPEYLDKLPLSPLDGKIPEYTVKNKEFTLKINFSDRSVLSSEKSNSH